jgi:hypothetical protein
MHRSPAITTAIKTAIIALLLGLASGTAAAAGPDVEVSGFGTAGFAITDSAKATFVRSQEQPVGVDETGDVGLDSLLAVQATVRLNDMFSATGQAMVRRLFTSTFALDVPVFFAKADLTHDLALRVGRIQLPVFMSSDYRQVGYSNTWVRPPVEVYGMIPFDTNDGADLLYRTTLGPVDISAQAFYGRTDATVSNTAQGLSTTGTSTSTVNIQARRSWGANLNVTLGPLTLRAGRNQSSFTSISDSTNQFIAAINAAGFPALAARLNPVNVPFEFTDYGLSFDGTHLTVQGEVVKETIGGFVPSADGEYILAGYRVRKFTPYAMFARQKITSARTDTTIPAVGALIPLAQGVNQLINSVGGDQHTTSLGLRWDLHESMDLKLQVDRVTPQGNGLLIFVKPGFHGPLDVASLTLDFVF